MKAVACVADDVLPMLRTFRALHNMTVENGHDITFRVTYAVISRIVLCDVVNFTPRYEDR